MSKVPRHKHVTLDESVFHAYQDIASMARYSGETIFKPALERLDAALDVFYVILHQ